MMKILITLLSMLLIVCSVAFVACGNKTAEIVDWTDQTIEIGYGETYNLNLVATDTENNVYTLTAEVETENGDKVEVNNGKFVVTEKCDYIIKYSLALEKETLTRTVTAKVVGRAAPVVRIDGYDSTYLKGMTIAFPEATVYDYFDGGDLTYSVAVYKKTAEGKTAVEFDKENNKFTATETGEYCLTYSSTNAYGSTGTADRNFSVKLPEDLKNLAKITEETHELVYNTSIADQGYEAAGSEKMQTLSGDYSGNAKRFKVWSNPGFNLKNDMNPDTAREMAKYYNSVTMWLATDVPTEESGTAIFSIYGDVKDSLQWSAYGNKNLALKSVQGKWTKLVMKSEDFVDLAVNGEFIKLFCIYVSGKYSDANVYVGDIMFENIMQVENNDIGRIYMTKSNWQAEGLTGDYNGNAYKFYQPVGGINNGFRYINEYTAQELDEIKASGKNKVVLPVAFDFGGDATLRLYNQGFEGFANPGETKHSAAIGNLKTWLNWEISIDDFKTLLAEKDYEYFRPWYEQILTDEFGNVQYKENGDPKTEGAYVTGSTNGTGYTYYFGELSFVYREPTILKVTSGNYSNYFNPDVTNAYISATRLETLDIDGNYSGDATQFMIKGKVTNAGYRVRVPYTEQELIVLKDNYNTVTMWLSATGVLTNSFNIDTNYTNTFATLAGADGFGVTPKWQKLSITMDKFISLVDFETGTAFVLATAHWSNGTYADDVSLYFGDMYFEYIEPTILNVNADNYTSYYNTDGIPRTYVSAEDLATLNILGEYTGNAVRFDMSTYKTNGGYKIKIPYTEQELLALKSKYNTVSTYVAITGVNGGKFFVDNATSRANYIANLAGYAELSITPTWQKISITIDQLITSMNSTNATVKDYCPLIATSGAYATYDTNVYMYFGDMIFENIVSE